jgi:hypothetical protein
MAFFNEIRGDSGKTAKLWGVKTGFYKRGSVWPVKTGFYGKFTSPGRIIHVIFDLDWGKWANH